MLGVALGVVVAAAAGCSSSPEVSADEAEVCDTFQQMVDELAAEKGSEALRTLVELDRAVAATSNPTLADAGTELFTAIGEPVDYGELTVDESVALGNEVLAEAEAAVGRLGDECARLGTPVTAPTR